VSEVCVPPCPPPQPAALSAGGGIGGGRGAEHAAVWAGAQRRYFQTLKLVRCAAAWLGAPADVAPPADALRELCASAVHAGALPLLRAAARAQPPRWSPFARLAAALVDVLREAGLVGTDGGIGQLTLIGPVHALLLAAGAALSAARQAGQLAREDAAAEARVGELLAQLVG
jgi:hypothetical protein